MSDRKNHNAANSSNGDGKFRDKRRNRAGANGKSNPAAGADSATANNGQPHAADAQPTFTPHTNWEWPLTPEEQQRKHAADRELFDKLRAHYTARHARASGTDGTDPRFAAPSPDSRYWQRMIGVRQLRRYKYKPPLSHTFRAAPRYVQLDAEAAYLPPTDRRMTDTERVIYELDRDIQHFRAFTMAAVDTLYLATEEEAGDEHLLDAFDDTERSVLIRGLFDNLEQLLKIPPGAFGGYLIGTVHRVQRWILEGNDLLDTVECGMNEHLAAAPWRPETHRWDYDVDGHMERHPPQPRLVEQLREEAERASKKWPARLTDLRHRLGLCGQVFTAATGTGLHSKTAGWELQKHAYTITYDGRVVMNSAGKAYKLLAQLITPVGDVVDYASAMRAIDEAGASTQLTSQPEAVREVVKQINKAIKQTSWRVKAISTVGVRLVQG